MSIDFPNRADREAHARMQAALDGAAYTPPHRPFSQRLDERYKQLRRQERSLTFKTGENAVGHWHDFATCLPDTSEAAQRRAVEHIRFQHNSPGYQFSLPDLDTLTPQMLSDQMQAILHDTPGIGGIQVQPHIGSRWKLTELLTGELSPESRKLTPAYRAELKTHLQASNGVGHKLVPLHGPAYARDLHEHGFALDLTLATPALAAQLPRLVGLLHEIDATERLSLAGRGREMEWDRFTPQAVAQHIETLCDRFDALGPNDKTAARLTMREIYATAHYGYLAQAREAVLYGTSDLPGIIQALDQYQPSPRLRISQTANSFGVHYKEWGIDTGGGREGDCKMLGGQPPQLRVYFDRQSALDQFATALINLTKPGWRENKLPPSARPAAPLTLAVDNSALLASEMRTAPQPSVRIRETPSQPAYKIDDQGIIRPDFLQR